MTIYHIEKISWNPELQTVIYYGTEKRNNQYVKVRYEARTHRLIYQIMTKSGITHLEHYGYIRDIYDAWLQELKAMHNLKYCD